MPVPEVAESFAGSVNRITLGATKDDGGTRSSTITVGGAKNVVYGGTPEEAGETPVVAMDVLDSRPADWPKRKESNRLSPTVLPAWDAR